MFCPNCGRNIPDGSRFCGACGAQFTGGQQAPGYGYGQPYNNQMYNNQPYNAPVRGRQNGFAGAFRVHKLPMLVIAIVTVIGLLYGFGGGDAEEASTKYALIGGSVPSLLLLVYVYWQDKLESEPIGLLLKLFILGAVSCVAAAFIEAGVEEYLFPRLDIDEPFYELLLVAFVEAALVEEVCKYAVLKFGSWRSRAFDFQFDGVVYAATTALGFATLESILYIMQMNTSVAVARAVAPIHFVVGIYVGHYYGKAKTRELNGDRGGALITRWTGVLIAVILHGVWDTLALADGEIPYLEDPTIQIICLIALIVVLNVLAYYHIKKYSHEDAPV